MTAKASTPGTTGGAPVSRGQPSRVWWASIEQEQPSWEQVLAEDLMPVWERAAVRPAVRAAASTAA